MAQHLEGETPLLFLRGRMLFKTRESDGDTVITPLGCLFVLLTFPVWIVIGLGYGFYKAATIDSRSNSTNRSSRSRDVGGGSLDDSWRDRLGRGATKRRQNRLIKRLRFGAEQFWDTKVEYTTAKIPKRSGGTRELSIPSSELKKTQKMLARALERELGRKVHKVANAYVKGRNTVTNAVPHLECAVLIKLDIKDFFPSITRDMLRPLLWHFAYREPQALERILDLCMTGDGLPQGAPTSPILSNLVLRDVDVHAYQLANLMGAKYSRYADDLTFSLVEADSTAARKIVAAVRAMLAKHGFELNDKANKLKILRGHQAQEVCGITLNSGKPTISRKRRREVRAARHAIENGRPSSMSLAALEGWESYIRFVHRERH